LAGKPHRKIADIDHFLYFTPSFLEAFAHLIRYQPTQRVFVFAEGFADLSHHFAAPGCRPVPPLQESLSGGPGHLLILLPVGRGDRADQLSVSRRIRTNIICASFEPTATGRNALVISR